MSDPLWPRPSRLIAPVSGGRRKNSHLASPFRDLPNSLPLSDEKLSNHRKHKTTACESCKQKKLKCRGGPPCDHCIANDIDCQIDELSDMRRKGSMERKIDLLEDAERLLLDLVEALKNDERNIRTSQLINLIRSNASLDEIRLFIERQFSLEERDRMPAIVETQSHCERVPEENSCARPRRRVLPVQRLADIPIYRVPAKPWTTVTDDDDLVSHLVSIWFTWSQPWFHWVNRDLFIRDMQAGKLDCGFCSPFLVNAILAEASLYSDYSEVFTVPDDMMSRGSHFHEETRRRLLEEQEEMQAKLPTIQGLITFFTRITMMGKDRIGWMYMDMAIRAAREYDASHPYRPTDQGYVQIVEDARSEALWGVFNLCCTANLCALRHVAIEPPRRPRPPVNHEDPRDDWTPYPMHMDSIPGHLSCVFHWWCDLCCIMVNITRTFFDADAKRPSSSQILNIGRNIERKLRDWYANLPNCLHVEESTVPHILVLHMFYHTVSLQLCSFIRFRAQENLEFAYLDDILKRNFATARRIATLLATHRQRWGTRRMHPSVIHCVAVGCFTLLEELESSENNQAFVTLCNVTRDCSHHFSLAQGVLQMIQVIAQQKKVMLPQEMHSLFQALEMANRAGKNSIRFNSLYLNSTIDFLQQDCPQMDEENDQPSWDCYDE